LERAAQKVYGKKYQLKWFRMCLSKNKFAN